jgi:CRISPR-associated protein (Cas_Cmr3)
VNPLQQWVTLDPLDTLIVRDGRETSFGDDSYVISGGNPAALFPWPSSVAGAVATALSGGGDPGRFVDLRGPLLVSPEPHPVLWFPVPHDVVDDEGTITRLHSEQPGVPGLYGTVSPRGAGCRRTGWPATCRPVPPSAIPPVPSSRPWPGHPWPVHTWRLGWVSPGTARPGPSPRACSTPSSTCGCRHHRRTSGAPGCGWPHE